MKQKIINILSNPFFLAFLISSVIIYFLPPVFEKYKATLLGKNKIREYYTYSYHDFDNNGVSEKILFNNRNSNGGSSIEIFTNSKIIDQWNFMGKFSNNYMFGDYDNNGFDEIYLITYKNDSVFLNGIEPIPRNKTIIKHKFISKFNILNNFSEVGIIKVGLSDLNNDGFKEIIFVIICNLTLQPRNIFAYDIINDTVYKSLKSGCNIGYFVFFDLNNNDFNEIINLYNSATGNFHKPFPYSDQYSWLMVFNRQLKFLFQPVKIGQYPSMLYITPFKPENKTYLAVFHQYNGTLDIPCSILLFNNKGKLLKKQEFESYEHLERACLISNSKKNRKQLFFIYDNGLIEQLDSSLNIIETKTIEGITNGNPFAIDDFDGDGKDEFLFWGKDRQTFILVRNNFSSPVVLNVPNNQKYNDYSIIKNGNGKPDIYFQFTNYSYTFQYYKNTLYYFKYLVYIGVYTIILLFILILNKIQKHRIEQKHEAEKKIAELQIRTIKNQLNPHFILNLMSSIGDLFDKKDSKQAHYIFSKYSTLLRQSVLNSDKFAVSLAEELNFVENYLYLEKFRFDKKFDFEIIRNNMDNNVTVPKMLIHSFVENAVKHGIKHLPKGGKINVIARFENNICIVVVKDNGIGREKSQQISKFSTGKGLTIVNQIIDSYNKLKKTNISYAIKDLNAEKEETGTQVIITIPFFKK